MGLVEKRQLVNSLSPPLDALLATQLVDEFVSMEQRFIQRDWGVAELDGGQFCEALGRLLYEADSRNLSHTKSFSDCVDYIFKDQVKHTISPRHDAIHICKSLQLVYKFRSQRGAVHITPNYSPNHMDAKLVIEVVRWCMSECLRVLGQGDRESIAKMIRELLQFDVPVIGVYEDKLQVQRTDLPVQDEVIMLLHFSGEEGMSRRDVGQYCMGSAPSVTRSLQALCAADCRQAIRLESLKFRLTDLGAKYVRENLANKLLVE